MKSSLLLKTLTAAFVLLLSPLSNANPPKGQYVDGKLITNRAGLTVEGAGQKDDLSGKTVIIEGTKIKVVSSNPPDVWKNGIPVYVETRKSYEEKLENDPSTVVSKEETPPVAEKPKGPIGSLLDKLKL